MAEAVPPPPSATDAVTPPRAATGAATLSIAAVAANPPVSESDAASRLAVLVTGGAGFIGAHLAAHLRSQYGRTVAHVVLLDKFIDTPYSASVKRDRLAGLFGTDLERVRVPGAGEDQRRTSTAGSTMAVNDGIPRSVGSSASSPAPPLNMVDTVNRTMAVNDGLPSSVASSASSPAPAPPPPRLTLVEGDASSVDTVSKVLTAFDVTVVFALAAEPGVRCQSPDALAANVGTVVALCSAIQHTQKVTTVVFTSTSAVYGSTATDHGSREDDPPAPLGSYAEFKLAAEDVLKGWAMRNASDDATLPRRRVVIARLFTVYGPWGRPDMLLFNLLAAAYNGQRAVLLQQPNGDQVARDFTHVSDVVDGLVRAAWPPADQRRATVATYNLGYGKPATLQDVADLVKRTSGRPLPLNRDRIGAEEAALTWADTTQARRDLGWEPRVCLEEGVRETVAWYRHHLSAPPPLPPPPPPPSAVVIAVVATVGRAELARALRSIRQQRVQPCLVIVVHDAASGGSTDAICTTAELALGPTAEASTAAVPFEVTTNARTGGASGTWNTGIVRALAFAHARGFASHRTYVAILDDDDEWKPLHLAACLAAEAARGGSAQQVVAGLHRYEDGIDRGRQTIPDPQRGFTRRAFYEGNPHIQGSNMFVSLALLCRVGLFNEALRSTTDRDLGARTAALPPHEVGVVALGGASAPGSGNDSDSVHTVICHADQQRADRLSVRGSAAKREGLRAFLSLHGPNMLAASREAFRARAATLFGADLRAEALAAAATPATEPLPLHAGGDEDGGVPPLALPVVVGIIADADDGVTIRPLLADLARLQADPGRPVVQLFVIVLENGRGGRSSPSANRTHADLPGPSFTPFSNAVHPAAFAPPAGVSALTSESSALPTGARSPAPAPTRSLPPPATDTPPGAPTSLAQAVQEEAASRGLLVTVVTADDVAADADASVLPRDPATDEAVKAFTGGPARLPIAQARTLVQLYAYCYAQWVCGLVAAASPRTTPVAPIVWILDDDKALDPLVAVGARGQVATVWAGKQLLRRAVEVHETTGAAIVLGCDTEAPPLPALASLRLQLLDVQALVLAALACDDGDAPLVACEEVRSRGSCLRPGSYGRDAYHDTSTARTDHLEVPVCAACFTATGGWGLSSAVATENAGSTSSQPALPVTARAALALASGVLRDIAAGAMVTRPLVAAHPHSTAKAAAEDSVLRGGCTFFFTLDALRLPNVAPHVCGRITRRSDMVACILNRDLRGLRVVRAPDLAVRHRRVARDSPHQRGASHALATLVEDIGGHAIYMALDELSHSRRPGSAASRALTTAELANFAALARKHLAARGLAAQVSLGRAHGLLASIEAVPLATVAADMPAWLHQDPSVRPLLDAILTGVQDVRRAFHLDGLWPSLLDALTPPSEAELTGWLNDVWRAYAKPPAAETVAVDAIVGRLRERAARTVLRGMARGATPPVGLVGGEGVTFKLAVDGGEPAFLAVKVLDAFSLRVPDSRTGLDAIVQLASPLQALQVWSAPLTRTPALVRPWLEGAPYVGGHGMALVDLLRRFKAANVVCANVGPSNLLLRAAADSSGGMARRIDLVDYGLDIVEYTPTRFRLMAVRAFLCWRWAPTRQGAAMTELLASARSALEGVGPSMTPFPEERLPEAAGFADFEEAIHVDAGQIEQRIAEYVAALAAASSSLAPSVAPRAVLDMGCGKGQTAAILSRSTSIRLVLGYDPDPTLAAAWARHDNALGPPPQFTSSLSEVVARAHAIGGFEVVVCCRVLCTMASDDDARQLLRDVVTCMAPDGTLLLGICHPATSHVRDTTLQTRDSPSQPLSGSATLHKRHRCGPGQDRLDVHRPLPLLRRLVRSVGLECVDRPAPPAPTSVDLGRFEACPELLVLPCRLTQPAPVRCPVALLIKACAMDWRTLEAAVQHLVGALEGPHAFHAGIYLVLDGCRENFPRPHSAPCEHDELVAIATRLKRQGLIDVIIDAGQPRAAADVAALNRRWFNLPTCEATHAANGAPTYSTLVAFETIAALEPGDLLLLQVDVDVMVRRGVDARGLRAPFVDRIMELFDRDPTALTVSLPVAPCAPPAPAVQPWTALDARGLPFRTEVRACFLHLPRLLAARPLHLPVRDAGEAGSAADGVPPSWHRAVDATVLARPQALRSYRGGDANAAFFVHPPNLLKVDVGDFGMLLDYVERGGPLPAAQGGCVDMTGAGFATAVAASGTDPAHGWLRSERFIFMVTGRRVVLSRAIRCLRSIAAQIQPLSTVSVGVIVVWDAPDAGSSDTPAAAPSQRKCFVDASWADTGEALLQFVRVTPELAGRTTVLMPRVRRGCLDNMLTVVNVLCTDPASVVINVDLDDALIGTSVLSTVVEAFDRRGAAFFAGGLLRMDKPPRNGVPPGSPTYAIDFSAPRTTRGAGNVWSHLRAARVDAYRAVLPADTVPALGEPRATSEQSDWLLQVPMCERSWRCVEPTRALYLYEPFALNRTCRGCSACDGDETTAGRDRDESRVARREARITDIVQRAPYACRAPRVAVIGDASFARSTTATDRDLASALAEELGYALTGAGYTVIGGGLGGVMEAAARGAARAAARFTGLREEAPSVLQANVLRVWTRVGGRAVGILPGGDDAPNPFVGSVVHTALGHARNAIVAATGDAVVLVGGGAGTLSEAAAAWSAGRLLISVATLGGVAARLAGTRLDRRARLHGPSAVAIPLHEDVVHPADSVAAVLKCLDARLPWHLLEALRRRSMGAGGRSPLNAAAVAESM